MTRSAEWPAVASTAPPVASRNGSIAPRRPGQMLAAALKYAGFGLQVFPVWQPEPGGCGCGRLECAHAGKHPNGRLAPHGVKDAAADESTIRRWWTAAPAGNIGVRCGQGSILVIDLDGPEAVKAFDERFPNAGGVRVMTGKPGGEHRWFRHPDGATFSNTVARLGPGIDVKSDGGSIVAPPSVHRSGKTYQFAGGLPETLPEPPAELVRALFDLSPVYLRTPRREPAGDGNPGDPSVLKRASAYVAKMGPAISGCGGDDHTFQVACTLVIGFNLPDGQAFDLLSKWNETCIPPWNETELEQKVGNARAYGTGEVGRLRHSTGPAAVSGEWEEPVPLIDGGLPVFPVDTLPRSAARFVSELSRWAQTPVDLAAMTVLSAVSAAVAGKVRVEPDPDWLEPVNLYTITVLPTGERKSIVHSRVLAPMAEWEREESERMADSVTARRTERAVLDGRVKRAERVAAQSGNPGDLVEAQRLARELERTPEVHAPRLLAGDVTPEALVQLLARHKGRMAVLTAEGASLFDNAGGRYSDGAANIDALLSAHCAETVRVDRVGRAPEFVEAPVLTLGLAVQPYVLRGLTEKAVFRDRGLLARFLYAMPSSRVGFRDVEPPAVSKEAAAGWRTILRSLLEMPGVTGEHGEPAAAVLRFSDGARSVFRSFKEKTEEMQRPGGPLHGLAGWGERFTGQIARIAALLHMSDHAASGEFPCSVQELAVRRAITIAEYLAPHARAAFAEMGVDAAMDGARALLAWIRSGNRTGFSKRDAFNEHRTRFPRVAEMDAPLGILRERCFIRDVLDAEAERGPGRRPSSRFEVNPAALAFSASRLSDGIR